MLDTPAAVLVHSAFYRFTPLADPAAAATCLRQVAQGLHGSIVVAREGLNGAVAGSEGAVAGFEAALQSPQVLGGACAGMVFRHSACDMPPFGRLKVAVRPELVALGLPGPAGSAPGSLPDERDASHLSPADWRHLLADQKVVLLDNRNHFEFRLGRFQGALDPAVGHFRDFAAWVQAQAPAWRAAGQPVAMYCTGGIRCDKTAPWLRSLGLTVWQLDGGILGYLQAAPADDRLWQGDCLVFDRRIALDRHLQPAPLRADQVYDAQRPDEAWRLQRARRLEGAVAAASSPPTTPPITLPTTQPTALPGPG